MTDAQRQPPPYAFAGLLAALVLVVYIATLAPTTAFWDTSEYIAAAKTLGIPHPPGNPLFVLLAHVFGLLPLAASYAVRINLFAAVTSALSAGLWFLVAERWLRNLVSDRLLRLGAAATGVLVGALSWTVWNQSTVNEKVYTVSLFFMALVTWLAVHWGDDEPGPHRDRWLILIAYLLALTSTNHMMGVLAAPAVIVYVLWTDWRVVTRWPVLLGIVVAVVIGMSPNYLFLPIRAAQYPAINEGEPVCASVAQAIQSALPFQGDKCQKLSDVLNRVQYGKPPTTTLPWQPSGQPRTIKFLFDQLANYWQYFSWQFARDWSGRLQSLATALFAVTGLAGLWSLLRRDRRAGIAALAMFGTLTFALIWYLNFKYGFSIFPDRPDITTEMREVRERDYFFLCSFAFFGTLVAAGVGAAAQELAARFRSRAAALPVFLLGLIPFFGNRQTASRSDELVAHEFARDLLESVEPYGILITAGDNDTFPLWFAQEVEGIRPDVTLANLSLMNTDWHLRQIRRRPTPEFDPAKSIELWKPRSDTSGIRLGVPGPEGWKKPAGPALAETEQELDSLPEYSRVQKGMGVRFGEVQVAFGSEILERKDIAALYLIRDNLAAGKRPVYFAWSAGGYPDESLGLTPYLVSQGLVRKLYPKPVEPGGNIVLTQMGYTDLERSRALLEKSYHWQSVTRNRPRGWVDAPSASILRLYAIIYGGMASAFREHGDSAFAARADSIASAVDREIRKSGRSR
jgi:transmembrane protein TMEM260 (protein O-mannosyltransferase)